jgi:hypothetical protein
MATEPAAKPASDWTTDVQRAWGNAQVKTGTEHLDLGMVRRGKKTLEDAKARELAAPPKR